MATPPNTVYFVQNPAPQAPGMVQGVPHQQSMQPAHPTHQPTPLQQQAPAPLMMNIQKQPPVLQTPPPGSPSHAHGQQPFAGQLVILPQATMNPGPIGTPPAVLGAPMGAPPMATTPPSQPAPHLTLSTTPTPVQQFSPQSSFSSPQQLGISGSPQPLIIGGTPMMVYTPSVSSPSSSHNVSPSASLTAPPGMRPPPPRYDANHSPSASHSNSVSHSPATTPSSSITRIVPNAALWGFAVVDPLHPRLQRVPLTPSVVSPTAAVNAYDRDVVNSSTKPCLSTVCLRYNSELPDGGCPHGTACTLFHVDAKYLAAAREVSEPLCCGQHNCYFTKEMIRSNGVPHLSNCRFVLIMDRVEVEIDPTQIAYTVGLEQLPLRPGRTRVITGKSLCRLHFDKKCKWTKDCAHIHVCRELFKYLQAFHYPSLCFLLENETDPDKIFDKIQQKMILEFIKSDCSTPMINSLVESKKTAALEALGRCGATIPQASEMEGAVGSAASPSSGEGVHQQADVSQTPAPEIPMREEGPSTSSSDPLVSLE